jgi:hypothetical protein
MAAHGTLKRNINGRCCKRKCSEIRHSDWLIFTFDSIPIYNKHRIKRNTKQIFFLEIPVQDIIASCRLYRQVVPETNPSVIRK